MKWTTLKLYNHCTFTDEGGCIVSLKRLNYCKTWGSACQRIMTETASVVIFIILSIQLPPDVYDCSMLLVVPAPMAVLDKPRVCIYILFSQIV